MDKSQRGWALTLCAVLLGIMAISNFSKPFQYGPTIGFVFFGTRQSGVPNMILGPLFGLYLAIYVAAIWRMKRYALPMAYAYAAYVIINLTLWTVKQHETMPLGFFLGYIPIAVAVSSGAAFLLNRRKADLA